MTQKKIAVVEDEESLRRVLVEWLELEGYKTVGAASGQEAVVMLPRELPDLILLDVILPELNGFEVMERLRENPATAKIPVVILSNLGDDEQRHRASKLGAVDYLVKAEHDFPSIKRVVERVLNHGV